MVCWTRAGATGQSLQRKNRRAASVADQSPRDQHEPGAGQRPAVDEGRAQAVAERRGGQQPHHRRELVGELGARDDDPAQGQQGDPQQVGDGEHALGAQRATEQQGQGREGPRPQDEGDQRSRYAAQRRLPAQRRAERADDHDLHRDDGQHRDRLGQHQPGATQGSDPEQPQHAVATVERRSRWPGR